MGKNTTYNHMLQGTKISTCALQNTQALGVTVGEGRYRTSPNMLTVMPASIKAKGQELQSGRSSQAAAAAAAQDANNRLHARARIW